MAVQQEDRDSQWSAHQAFEQTRGGRSLKVYYFVFDEDVSCVLPTK